MDAVAPTDLKAANTTNVLAITTAHFVTLSAEATCREAIARFVDAPRETPDEDACVVSGTGAFVGLIALRDCLAQPPEQTIAGIVRHVDAPARDDWSAEQTARAALRSAFSTLPVLDAAGQPVGLVTQRDAYRFLFEAADEDATRQAKLLVQDLDPDHYMTLSIWSDYWRRAPWIVGLAIAGLAAGYIVHMYESALDALVILALYMPMVADTGGNVGTQSASLITRAISFGGVTMGDWWRVVWRELRIALMMGATLFVFAYLKVLLISNAADVPLGLTLNDIGIAIGVALAAQVVTATLIGAGLPLVSGALKQDPALVSGPALTTIVDVTGLLLYFSITTKMLGLELVSD